jgi:hypothetical protein
MLEARAKGQGLKAKGLQRTGCRQVRLPAAGCGLQMTASHGAGSGDGWSSALELETGRISIELSPTGTGS